MLKEKQKPKRISKTTKMSKWIKRTSDFKANVKLVKRAKSWNVIRNTRHIAWAVELTYVHVVDKRKSHWVARVRRVAQLLSKFLFVNQTKRCFRLCRLKRYSAKDHQSKLTRPLPKSPVLPWLNSTLNLQKKQITSDFHWRRNVLLHWEFTFKEHEGSFTRQKSRVPSSHVLWHKNETREV